LLLFRLFLLHWFLFFNYLLAILVVLLYFLNDYFWLWLWWWWLQRSEHLHIGIEIKQSEKTVGVISSGPNVDVTLDTSRSKVLVFLLVTERNDLRYGLSVGQFKNVQLVLVREPIDDEVTATKTRDQEVAEFTCNSHRVERLMSLKCVTGALEMLVPQLD